MMPSTSPSITADLAGRPGFADQAAAAHGSSAEDTAVQVDNATTPSRPLPASADSDAARERSHSAALKPMIVRSVDFALRSLFPSKYFQLCHAYAIVGSNVASIALDRDYRPVAGLAVIDCGGGSFMRLTDNQAFAGSAGGAYHCWIESCASAPGPRELVDISFMHNSAYAKTHHIAWRKKSSSYQWGRFDELVLEGELDTLPRRFPTGKVWLRETPEGTEWMARQVAEHIEEYLKITVLALKKLRQDQGLPY
jgi:hypothetical protein